jgi:putative radical SAM enzyme (TIGR03279 family)
MDAIIHSVEPQSIAQALGLTPGTRVLAVNGRKDLEDLLDYRYELADAPRVTLQVQYPNGQQNELNIDKHPDEDLGLVFQSPLFTPIRTCNNACPFCFIDQQPAGLRPSLYVKDDDYRLSYFSNTYITLTNLTPRDRQRIERIRPGPLYVSVHATDTAVRRQLLNNPKAPPIMEMLSWLKGLDIPFHCQVVLCPGVNDGAVLAQTLADLATLRPAAESVAVVPVGLTQHRADLPTLTAVTPETARAVIEVISAFAQHTPQFVYPSDEFYYRADLPLPSSPSPTGHDDLPQLDDGVGTVNLLQQRFFALEATLPEALHPPRQVMIATGRLGAMALAPIAQRMNAIAGLHVDVLAVTSGFWGQQVDVAGLITGSDLQQALQKEPIAGYAAIVIPGVMLKQDTELFLDGLTLTELSKQVGKPFVVIQDPYSAQALVDALLGVT